MKIAECNVNAAVLIPKGEYLDGSAVAADTWIRAGVYMLQSGFAESVEKLGLLEIVSIDGENVVWGACCDGGHAHP